MKAAVVVGAIVLLMVLNIFASARLVRANLLARAHKTAWLLLVWLAPLLGALLALQVARESIVPAPVAGSFGGEDPGVNPVGYGSDYQGGPDGGGSS